MNRFLTGRSCVPLWNGPRRTSTPPSTSAGEHRLRCTTITVCKRPNCRKSCSVSSNTPWSIKVFLCCAALTRSTGCRTPATPKSARSRFAQPENSTSSLPLPKPGSTSFPTTTVDKSSSLVTRSMKPAPSLRNTSATWTRVCPSSCPATTSHRTTLPKNPSVSGAATLICSTPTGSTITSTSPPHTTWESCGWTRSSKIYKLKQTLRRKFLRRVCYFSFLILNFPRQRKPIRIKTMPPDTTKNILSVRFFSTRGTGTTISCADIAPSSSRWVTS